MNEIIPFLNELGLNVNLTVLILICGFIEVVKKAVTLKSHWYVLMAAVLSLGAAFVVSAPVTLTSVLTNTVTYFVISTLFYDYILEPIRKFFKEK